MNAAADAKIKMLKSSMQCFVFGLLGLLPVIGLPFALAALVDFGEGSRPAEKNLERRAALPDLGRCLRRSRHHFLGFHPDHHHLSRRESALNQRYGR